MDLSLSAPCIGTNLARRYRLERLIGEGASSWVFAATDARLEREVAVKLLKPRAAPNHSTQRRQFVQEGRVLAKLTHPHVVAVHDAGETPDGHGYIVMELSHAGTLEAELGRRSVLGLEEVMHLIFPLLGALACAHDRGIVHRDLKPANIALMRRGDAATSAKLLDFGIARASGENLSSGGLVGTPAYMAPEQARGEALTPAADVWAIGAVVFRCLSGSLPFEASSSVAMLLKLVQERASRLALACPSLPPRVSVALDRALEPDPVHRYPNARTFARVLAIACRQDGVSIDMNPEPLGLPEFDAWLARADVESARRHSRIPELRTGGPSPHVLPTAVRAVAADAKPARRSRANARHLLWPLAALGAGMIITWSVLGDRTPAHWPSRSVANFQREGLTPDGTREPPFAPSMPAAVSPQESTLRPLVPSLRDSPPPPRQRAGSTGGTTAGAKPAMNAAADTSGEQRDAGLITNWNW